MRRAAIVTRPIDPAAVIAEVRSPKFGAVSLFVGTVRETSDGRRVTAIDYSAYVSMAQDELDRIVDEASEKFGVGAILVEHRIGPLALGEVSVAIGVAHQHRAPALEATSFLIERIKAQVPIWKLEHYADGRAGWVDPDSVGATP